MDWLITISSLLSYYLISEQKKIGFIVGGISCIIGILYFYDTISLLIMYLCFGVLNIKGYIKWKNMQK